ncbi:hypothetical protein L3V86_03275 [Thiotrichales bacterium 19S11-10]|nr:hypothetical protein [Thiotrichales bacterium 19S11-10]MCF6806954.1 hypothetical protein [Thiotrichales bacterium 19S9-11]MCF6810923.1 hypothetical protein [Thiotrichales bacterium 19S9-12]
MNYLERLQAKATLQGAAQKAQEMARNLLSFGDPVDKVVTVTGLKKSVVLELKKELHLTKR